MPVLYLTCPLFLLSSFQAVTSAVVLVPVILPFTIKIICLSLIYLDKSLIQVFLTYCTHC